MARRRGRYHAQSASSGAPPLVTVVSRYLAQYAEHPGFQVTLPSDSYQHVLVIPAYRETLSQLEQVWRKLSPALIIIVVNSPTPSDPETLELLAAMPKRWQTLSPQLSDVSDEYLWYQADLQTILVIDRCTRPLSKGVGEARKIGCDTALSLIFAGVVSTNWIHNTDADAELPQDYFEVSDQTADDAGFLLYPFEHNVASSTPESIAAALYEFSILWYAFGTHAAKSPYGYPSIGSTIACDATAYARVRGWPKRTAGEDFYFLNKLRKVGQKVYANCQPIQLSSRASERVPFGTGPGIRKIAALIQPVTEHVFYHPACFLELQSFLTCLGNIQHSSVKGDWYRNDLQQRFARESGLESQILSHQHQTQTVFNKFLDDWFDGFRTLKFIHYVRDQQQPSVPFEALWQSALLPDPCPDLAPEAIQVATQQLWYKLQE